MNPLIHDKLIHIPSNDDMTFMNMQCYDLYNLNPLVVQDHTR